MYIVKLGGTHTLRWGQDYEDFLSSTVDIHYSLNGMNGPWVLISTENNTIDANNQYNWTNSFTSELTNLYIRIQDTDYNEVNALKGPFVITNNYELKFDKKNTIYNIDSILNLDINVRFTLNNDDINISDIQLDSTGYVNIVGKNYDDNQSQSIKLSAGKVHSIGGIHKIIANDTTKGIGIHVKV